MASGPYRTGLNLPSEHRQDYSCYSAEEFVAVGWLSEFLKE